MLDGRISCRGSTILRLRGRGTWGRLLGKALAKAFAFLFACGSLNATELGLGAACHTAGVYCFGCELSQWRRGACRGDYNTTSARLSMAQKKTLLLRTISTRRNALSLKFLRRRHVPPVTETKMKGSDKPVQLTGACRSNDRLVQKPNQPRLLSTSNNSWHSISNAIWQLKATFATSQILEVTRDFVTRSMQSNDT